MRFVIGLLLGFGIGFAAVILLAPERPKAAERKWPPTADEEAPAPGGNHRAAGGLQSFMSSLRGHLDEAVSEAKKASAEAEKEMRSRYQKMAKRPDASGK